MPAEKSKPVKKIVGGVIAALLVVAVILIGVLVIKPHMDKKAQEAADKKAQADAAAAAAAAAEAAKNQPLSFEAHALNENAGGFTRSCPAGQRLVARDLYYGTGDDCRASADLHADAMAAITGQTEISGWPNQSLNAYFGDPCPGRAKKLHLNSACATEAQFGNLANL